MKTLCLCALFVLLIGCGSAPPDAPPMPEVRLMILEPAHFHAALIQREMYPWISKRVSVYAPVGSELIDYLNRVSLFNNRAENPTSWEIDVHSSPDFFERMLRERPGNVVITSGRNRGKIDRILASIDAGLHFLADKPWIISSPEMPKLEQALDKAERKGVIAYDIMTERHEISTNVQRELVNDEGVFGKLTTGSPAQPAITAESVHHIMKLVAGVPIKRPVWFFDTNEYGEGLADVGTHVVDLVQWTAFPEQRIDYRSEIQMLDGEHWPTAVTKEEFQRVTGAGDFPASVSGYVKDGKLQFFCNNRVVYALRGVHVKLDILWNWEAPPGTADSYVAVFRGTKAHVELRQGKAENFRPEVYVVPNGEAVKTEVFAALSKKVAGLQQKWPGVAVEERGAEARIVIPDRYRVGHEAHFAQVTNLFFSYMKSPKSMPEWEKSAMLAKYFVTTKGVELGQRKTK